MLNTPIYNTSLNLHTFKVTICTMLCKCFFCLYMQQKIQEMLQLSMSIPWHQFFLRASVQNSCLWLCLTTKSQNDFVLDIDIALDLPNELHCLVGTTELFVE